MFYFIVRSCFIVTFVLLRTYTESNAVSEASTGTAVDVTPLAGVEAVVNRQNVSVVVLTTNVLRKKQKHNVLPT